jgi:peptide/nickel transport system substrate-binding protein
MKKLMFLVAVVATTVLLLSACASSEPTPNEKRSETLLPTETALNILTSSGKTLTPNPVEASMPIYGGELNTGYWIPRTFDAHQKAGYGPTATLMVFNQLVMFDITYKECIPETIIGDLADRWETSDDGTEVTFYLHQGVKWHDGMPFTADDVIYSLDKMTDVNRSGISDWFPAYQSA